MEDWSRPQRDATPTQEEKPASPALRRATQYAQSLSRPGDGVIIRSSSCAQANQGWLMGNATDRPGGEKRVDSEAEEEQEEK